MFEQILKGGVLLTGIFLFFMFVYALVRIIAAAINKSRLEFYEKQQLMLKKGVINGREEKRIRS